MLSCFMGNVNEKKKKNHRYLRKEITVKEPVPKDRL